MLKRGFMFTLRRELYRINHYRTFWFSIVVIPILCFALFIALFDKGVATQLPMAIIDHDNTALSRQTTRMVDAGRFSDVVCELSSEQEAYNMMEREEIYAFLIIPRDFESKAMRGESVECPFFVSGVNILVSSLLQKDVIYTLQTISTGVQIQKLVASGIPQATVMDIALPINYRSHVLFNPYTNYAYFLLPGFMPMMLLMFSIVATIFAIGTEYKKGTAGYWLSGAKNSMTTALLAKLLPYFILMVLVGVIMLAMMFLWAGIPVNGSLAMLFLGTILLILAYQSTGVFIIGVLLNLRLALSIGAGYSVLAFSFSGLTFPYIGMFGLAKVLSHIFPFAPYIDLFIDQSMRGAPIVYSLHYIPILLAFLLLPITVLGRMKKACTNPKHWGKL